MFKKQNIYSVKERFINDYRKSPQWGWLALGAIWLTIVLMLIMAKPTLASVSEKQKEKVNLLLREWVVEDYTTSLPDYPMAFGATLQASQTEMAELYRRAKAISICEGYGKAGTLAQRNNNPGNLKARGVHDSQGHTIYPTKVAGWQALYNLLYKHRTKSIYQLSRFYASASDTWYRCVTSKL